MIDIRPAPGDPAPELSLPSEEGTPFRLADAAGRPALVTFLSHAA